MRNAKQIDNGFHPEAREFENLRVPQSSHLQNTSVTEVSDFAELQSPGSFRAVARREAVARQQEVERPRREASEFSSFLSGPGELQRMSYLGDGKTLLTVKKIVDGDKVESHVRLWTLENQDASIRGAAQPLRLSYSMHPIEGEVGPIVSSRNGKYLAVGKDETTSVLELSRTGDKLSVKYINAARLPSNEPVTSIVFLKPDSAEVEVQGKESTLRLNGQAEEDVVLERFVTGQERRERKSSSALRGFLVRFGLAQAA